MTSVLADTSVLLKWFKSAGEDEMEAAQALLAAHREQKLDVLILDLTLYELGNILLRSLRWPATEVADQLDDVLVICGAPLTLHPDWRRDAAHLAEQHVLTFYDAAFAGAARGLGVPLLSADQQLLKAGLAESVSGFVARLTPSA